jgi:hypothetical protein
MMYETEDGKVAGPAPSAFKKYIPWVIGAVVVVVVAAFFTM